MDYKEKLEAEMLEWTTGGADLYLYRSKPENFRIREQLDPPEGKEGT